METQYKINLNSSVSEGTLDNLAANLHALAEVTTRECPLTVYDVDGEEVFTMAIRDVGVEFLLKEMILNFSSGYVEIIGKVERIETFNQGDIIKLIKS